MKSNIIRNALFAAAAFGLAAQAFAASTVAGVPMSEKHMKAFGGEIACQTCHGEALPTSRPSDKACIGCHGTMDKIPTKPNKFDKFPHASAHYASTLECTTCHAEHKASKALCNDCHVVEWTNFK